MVFETNFILMYPSLVFSKMAITRSTYMTKLGHSSCFIHRLTSPNVIRGVLTYLAERGCATLMGGFFTRNP